MRFRRKSALEALDEAAKLRHDLRLRWLDEAERTQSQAATLEPEPSEYDPDYRSRRPFATNRPIFPNPDRWGDFISDAGWKRMAKAIINPTPGPQERITMNDEIKAGDMVRQWHLGTQYRVLAVEGEWLWLQGREGSEDDYPLTPVTGEVRAFRKLTPCPELWANVYPHIGAPPCSTRAEAMISAGADRIGVLHLSPNGDCEFIRTEEL